MQHSVSKGVPGAYGEGGKGDDKAFGSSDDESCKLLCRSKREASRPAASRARASGGALCDKIAGHSDPPNDHNCSTACSDEAMVTLTSHPSPDPHSKRRSWHGLCIVKQTSADAFRTSTSST